jgi:prepilin-type N-terminal cleavage/methylation domain-containing protein
MMQSNCKYIDVDNRPHLGTAVVPVRKGLTLLELIVVVAILVVLSSLAIPLLSSVLVQARLSTNATAINDVSRAVGSYLGRYGKYPDGWDSLLNTGGTLYKQLTETITGTARSSGTAPPALLATMALTQIQWESLNSAGITTLYSNNESTTAAPNMNFTNPTTLTAGSTVAKLIHPTSSTAFAAGVINVNQLDNVMPGAEYVVFGLGSNSTMRGTTIVDAPINNGVDAGVYYARMMCVFMVPGTAATESTQAKFVGCFAPDGSSLRDNMERYNGNVSDVSN